MAASSNSIAARLRKILPFMGRNTCSQDRDLAIRAFRRLYAESPAEFLNAYDAEVERLRARFPRETTDLIEQSALEEIDDQFVAFSNDDGTSATLFAAGFLAYGLENQELAAEDLTREDIAKLRRLLFEEYFDESTTKIHIYEHLIPLSHNVIADANTSYDFLHELVATARPDGVIPHSMSLDIPFVDYNYDEESNTDIAARFRLIMILVRSTTAQKPLMKKPLEYLGFVVERNGVERLAADSLLSTRWGSEFAALVSRRCGRGLRYLVTEPCLLNDTVRQLDYIVGLKRVMVAFTRTALDEGVAPENLIVSMGAFTDPQKGYSELRVAFARPEAPDDLLSGVPIPLPNGSNLHTAIEDIAAMVCDLFSFEGVQLVTPISPDCQLLTAEPDSMDRLYNSIHNIQKPLRKSDNYPRPGIPSMMLN